MLVAGQCLIIAGGFKDVLVTRKVTKEGSCRDETLSCNHEEADTRLIFHAHKASLASQIKQIVVWSPDTDVFILCIYHKERIYSPELWFRTGVKDKSRFIPVHTICTNFGSDLCKALLGFHALTGCDSTSGFASVGKVKFFEALKKHPTKYSSVSKLGNDLDVSELMPGIEQFICHTYDNKATVKEVNECRYRTFCQKRAANEALPPTLDSLLYHTKRCNFQALVWKSALVAQPEIPSPIGNGWEYEEDLDGDIVIADQGSTVVPTYMTQSAAPEALLEFIVCRCSKPLCKGNCKCLKEGLPCTEACTCMTDDSCENTSNNKIDSKNYSESEYDDSDSDND